MILFDLISGNSDALLLKPTRCLFYFPISFINVRPLYILPPRRRRNVIVQNLFAYLWRLVSTSNAIPHHHLRTAVWIVGTRVVLCASIAMRIEIRTSMIFVWLVVLIFKRRVYETVQVSGYPIDSYGFTR